MALKYVTYFTIYLISFYHTKINDNYILSREGKVDESANLSSFRLDMSIFFKPVN